MTLLTYTQTNPPGAAPDRGLSLISAIVLYSVCDCNTSVLCNIDCLVVKSFVHIPGIFKTEININNSINDVAQVAYVAIVLTQTSHD